MAQLQGQPTFSILSLVLAHYRHHHDFLASSNLAIWAAGLAYAMLCWLMPLKITTNSQQLALPVRVQLSPFLFLSC